MCNLKNFEFLFQIEKNQTGVEDMEFQEGILKKENVEIPGVNEKRSRISRAGVFKETHVTCGISIRQSLGFDLGISKAGVSHKILLSFQG